ncbi:MAG: hypothetical protein KDB61_06035, partial [Planctomycetes bacterium]|nr:hypothetical protein [Planctomycetota bacterium]
MLSTSRRFPRTVLSGLCVATILAGFFLFAGPLAHSQDAREAVPQEVQQEAEHPLTRVAFIGASVSDGFGNSFELEVGRNVPLGSFFRQTLAEKHAHARIFDYGSSQFFLEPERRGKKQLVEALKEKPTLVVGVDFLFWYAFGFPKPGSPRRAEGLEEGLKLLESIHCPLIIGDLPNVDHAFEGSSPLRGGHPILSPGQICPDALRLKLNERIRQWAAERDNVRVFPLSDLLHRMVKGGEMTVHGNRWVVEDMGEILQKDRLHPKVRGTTWTALFLADFALNVPGVGEGDFVWD